MIEQLAEQFNWLKENRFVRIDFMEHPETFERIYNNRIFSQNRENTIKDLKADVLILKDRIKNYKGS